MAQKVNIVLVDDIDGSEADETVSFSVDGNAYEIDLNRKNAQNLRDAVATYVAHGRRVSAGRGRRRRNNSGGPSPAEVREWARSQGMKVSERGRVSEEVRSAYDAAH